MCKYEHKEGTKATGFHILLPSCPIRLTNLKAGWYYCHLLTWADFSWTSPYVSSHEASPDTAGGWWCWAPFPGCQSHVLPAPVPAFGATPHGSSVQQQHESALLPMCEAPVGGSERRKKNSYLVTCGLRLTTPILKVQQHWLLFTAQLMPLFKTQLNINKLKTILKKFCDCHSRPFKSLLTYRH